MKFLYAAYAVTWIIHICYLGVLARGYRRIRQEIEELSPQQSKTGLAGGPELRQE